MTISELHAVLVRTGLPVAYEAFKNNQSLPCITYNVSYSDNFGADSKVYKKIYHMDIFLFTANKDLATEKLLEDELDNADLFYDVTESYLDNEKAFQILYQVEI